jgi:hypothetical protein
MAPTITGPLASDPELIPNGDRAAPDPEEQRWITSETVLALPSATVKVEVIDGACPKCVENKPLAVAGIDNSSLCRLSDIVRRV